MCVCLSVCVFVWKSAWSHQSVLALPWYLVATVCPDCKYVCVCVCVFLCPPYTMEISFNLVSHLHLALESRQTHMNVITHTGRKQVNQQSLYCDYKQFVSPCPKTTKSA